MSRSRPALATLASLILLLAVLSTTFAMHQATAGHAALVGGVAGVAAEPLDHLLVSEVVTGGASASDEFIELYNASATALPLEGLEVVYVTATGGTITRKASWAAGASPLPAGSHLLIANSAGVYAGIADLTYTNGLAATGGSVAIRILGAAGAIDAVGWGSAASSWLEGAAVAAPAAGHSIERLPGGAEGSGQDTDQNAIDFVERDIPDPQGAASPPIPVPTPQPTPDATATATSPATTATPSGVPSTPTGAPTAALTASPTPISTPAATVQPTTGGAPGTPTPSALPSAEPISIAAARALPDGTSVFVSGVSLTDGGFHDGGGYLADATGGIAVLLSDGTFPRGMSLQVQGELDQRFSQRTIRAAATGVTILAPGGDPPATQAATGGIGEAFEGELVEIDGVIVSAQTALTSGIAVDLDDGSGPIRVVASTISGIDVSGWTRNTRLHLRGVVGQRDSGGSGTAGYRVQPRDAADVVAIVPPETPTPAPSSAPSMGPSPTGAPGVLDIAAARSAPANSRVTVRGVVTLPSGLTEPGSAAIQDATGAILLRLGDEAGSLALGELVEVAGTRSTKAGMETLRVSDPPHRLGTRAQPDPLRRGTGALGEAHEATLVVTRGTVTLTPRRTSAQNVYFDIDDGSGPVRVFIGPRAGIETEGLLLGSVVEVSGVLGQETTGRLPDRGYRLWPRRAADLKMVREAPGVASGSTAGTGGTDQPGEPEGGQGTSTGATGGGGNARVTPQRPAGQQGVPRLEAPAPTATVPSAIPRSFTAARASNQPRAGGEPTMAAAALLALASLLLGGGGVATGPPGLARRLVSCLRERIAAGGEAGGGEQLPGLTGGAAGPPRLVPLSVVEDAHERAGRILPPT